MECQHKLATRCHNNALTHKYDDHAMSQKYRRAEYRSTMYVEGEDRSWTGGSRRNAGRRRGNEAGTDTMAARKALSIDDYRSEVI